MVSLGKKITIPLFAVIFFIAVSVFVAPLTLEPGTVRHADGNANMVDRANFWDTLPVYHRIIYYFGDFNCHQIEDRSYVINGNQMPMCTRCVGIFAGLSIGIGIAIMAPVRETASAILLNIHPKRLARLVRRIDGRIKKRFGADIRLYPFLSVISVILCIPMVLDGTLQLFSPYESTNMTRIVSGFVFGAVSFFWFSAYVHSVMYMPETPPYSITGPRRSMK